MRLDGIIETVAAVQKAKPELAKLKKAAEDVEAIFLKDLLGAMRRGMAATDGESSGMSMYKDLMDQAVATTLSKQSSIGISKMLYKDMAKNVIRQVQREVDKQA